MGRLYSNVNSRFRTLNYGRVTDQQLERASHTPRANFIEANEVLAELQQAVDDHHAQRILSELIRIKPIMEARPDKRRRPQEVSKELFKWYRKLRFKFPAYFTK